MSEATTPGAPGPGPPVPGRRRRWSPSLRLRLALAGIAVALVAVLVTAVAMVRLTTSSLRSELAVDLDTQVLIRDELAVHGLVDGDWDEVDEVVRDIALETGERVAVADLGGTILADSALSVDGEAAPLPSRATLVDPTSTFFAVEVAAEDVAFFNQALEPCLADVGVAVGFDEFGLVFPEDDLTLEAEERIFDCVEAETDADELFLALEELFEAEEAGAEEAAPPLQLFIGYGDEREPLFASGVPARLWLPVAGVMAMAVLTTVVVADRIARPLRSLTTATRSMRGGDLGARAEVSGGGEVAVLGRAFNDMAASIQDQDRARRTLTGDVAHELRSPLANLRGYLEGIQDGLIRPDEATIASLHQETMALSHLVDDLQQLSLAEAGRLQLRLAPVDIGDLVLRAVEAHRGSASGAGIELRVDADEGTVLSVDGERVRQILANLVANGIRHTPAGGVVTAGLRRTGGGGVAIEVADTGEGIPHEHQAQVFDRFFRVDRSRTRATGGTGLGLAIARELARAHGGDLTVASTPGHGATFTLTLPPASSS